MPVRIHLIGAGPVGCLLGIELARMGYEVDIFERRPDMRSATLSAGRSINLALSVRGIFALQELGIDQEILKRAIPMYGRMMHGLTGELSFQRYGLDDSQYINSISRAELNKALLTHAEESKGIRLHFNQRLISYDLKTRDLSFHREDNNTQVKVSTQHVIGCDGSASPLRQAMKDSAQVSVREEALDYGYKELTIPALAVGTGLNSGSNSGSNYGTTSLSGPTPNKHALEKNALHIWPRGTHMLIALPNFDGTFTCTLFLAWKGAVSFDHLQEASSIDAFFREHYADAAQLIPNLAKNFLEHPTGHMVTIHAFPWHMGDQVLLVGDAAHAIVPFFGQGLNCGFEDVTLIRSLFSQSKSLGEIFQNFSQQRHRDAEAIAQLALENFIEMRDKVAQPRFLLEKEIEKLLMKKFPDFYISKYALVTFSRRPYELALKVSQIQDKILAQLSHQLKQASDLDFALAEKLIREELAPLMTQTGDSKR